MKKFKFKLTLTKLSIYEVATKTRSLLTRKAGAGGTMSSTGDNPVEFKYSNAELKDIKMCVQGRDSKGRFTKFAYKDWMIYPGDIIITKNECYMYIPFKEKNKQEEEIVELFEKAPFHDFKDPNFAWVPFKHKTQQQLNNMLRKVEDYVRSK